MKPQKLWVIYGGESAERDVSIKTGSNLLDALKAKGYDAKGLEIKSRADLIAQFAPVASERPDLVVLGLHGTFGEDGRMQGFLDTIGVPYVGSGVLASAICFNKAVSQRLLREKGCPVAPFFDYNKATFSLEGLAKKDPQVFNKKWFIKAASQGSTIGIYRYDPKTYVDTERREAFEDCCHKAFRYDDDILIEEWIEGRELTCAIVGTEAYPLIEIRPNSKFYDYSSKYTAGQTEYLCPAPIKEDLTEKIQAACLRAYKILRCEDYARIDVMLREGTEEFFILEANTLPGMTATSLVPKAAKAKGLSFEDFVEQLVIMSYTRQKKGTSK